MPQISIRDLLERDPNELLLLDGGTGSSLEDRGVDVRSALWSSSTLLTAEGRAATRELHVDFLEAGADIVIANTHNVNPNTCAEFLESAKLTKRTVPKGVLNGPKEGRHEKFLWWIEQLGVEVARRAVPEDKEAVVAAGIGSEEPWAESTKRTQPMIRASLEPATRVLSGIPGTWILYEAVSTPPEVAAVAEVARELAPPDYGVAVTCGPDGKTWGGVTMADVVSAFEDHPPVAIFVQCTRYDVAGEALRALVSALQEAAPDVVPGIYANDGRTWKDKRWHGERTSPEAYADAAETWREAGARIIGGCCGTTPEHVAELHRRFR